MENCKNSQESKAGKAAAEWWQTLSEEQRKQMDIVDAFAYGVLHGWNNPSWISVEEEMPPFDWKENGTWRRSLPVLIYDPTRGIFVGCYESDDLYGKTYWIYDNGKRPTKEVSVGYEWDNVTHWMPLPTPPQGKEANND